ncbi:MAG: 16S rRNA (guanine(527)-N(7))-methyltransferase RsmG [Elusimicrobia bacterium]|nr:16S rRNA (guanine(527)-N(7))-methyltransferase RsmG [Elusimicrobiota bacterium]
MTHSSVPGWENYTQPLAGLGLPDLFFARADAYLGALQSANRDVNLVSSATVNDLRLHVVDSVQALRGAPVDSPCRAIDVGSGGGFPGVPLAIARPQWDVSLLDSLRKKQVALQSISSNLGWTNVHPLCARAEELARDPAHRESYDLAFCRAVGRFSTVLELTLPLLKVGGLALLHRGHEGPIELDAAQSVLSKLGGKTGHILSYGIVGLDFGRFIICIEKSSQTCDVFPRRPGVPEKKPLA